MMCWAMWSAAGFAMPMREGYAQEVYLVTSGELMSLYAANNICKAIERLSARPKSRCRLAGVICNAKNQPKEEELVAEFARRVNSSLIQFIPRDRVVQLAELNRKTVIEYEPASSPGTGIPRSCRPRHGEHPVYHPHSARDR